MKPIPVSFKNHLQDELRRLCYVFYIYVVFLESIGLDYKKSVSELNLKPTYKMSFEDSIMFFYLRKHRANKVKVESTYIPILIVAGRHPVLYMYLYLCLYLYLYLYLHCICCKNNSPPFNFTQKLPLSSYSPTTSQQN